MGKPIQIVFSFVFLFGLYSSIGFYSLPFAFSLLAVTLSFILRPRLYKRSLLLSIVVVVHFMIMSSPEDIWGLVQFVFWIILLPNFIINYFRIDNDFGEFCLRIIVVVNALQYILHLSNMLDISVVRNGSSSIRAHFLANEPSDVAKVFAFIMLVLWIQNDFIWKRHWFILAGVLALVIQSPTLLLVSVFYVLSRNISSAAKIRFIAGGFVYLFFYSSRFDDIAAGIDASANVRLITGFLFWNTLEVTSKIFGIGLGGERLYESVILQLNPFLESVDNGYIFSALQQVLVYYGILGFVVLFIRPHITFRLLGIIILFFMSMGTLYGVFALTIYITIDRLSISMKNL